jgi:hypothetical protein
MAIPTDKAEIIELLDKAYYAMNDVEDALIEYEFAATFQLKASDIADTINTLQQSILRSVAKEAQKGQ